MFPPMAGMAGLGNQLRQGLQGRNYEFDQVQEEVAGEQRSEIWLVVRSPSSLLDALQELH